MLETLKVAEEQIAESVQMKEQEPDIQDKAKDDQEGAKDDHWLDDQWEDFSSLEEEEEMARQIADAEKSLMKKFVRGLDEAPATPRRLQGAHRKTPPSRKTIQEGAEMTATPATSPTPPPSKRKRVTQMSIPIKPTPTKTPAKTPAKTPPKSPTIRKTRMLTPASKMTPKMKRTLNFKLSTPSLKKFTIGRRANIKEDKEEIGIVKEAKRKLQDRQRKERRENQVEMVSRACHEAKKVTRNIGPIFFC